MQRNRENGFTLIELMVVTAVMGFLVIAATSIMVSFSKFKYMADTQEQLKTEATFAANQIDLMIRNSSGIPDLCMSGYRPNPATQDIEFCDGTPKYKIDESFIPDPTGFHTNEGAVQTSITMCTGKNNTGANTGKDILDTALPNTDPNTANMEKPYREICIDRDNINNSRIENNYLVTQFKTEELRAKTGESLLSDNQYSMKYYQNNSYTTTGGKLYTPQTVTKYYNQIIFLENAELDNESGTDFQYKDGTVNPNPHIQKKIGVYAYPVGEDYNRNSACDPDNTQLTPEQTMCQNIRNLAAQRPDSALEESVLTVCPIAHQSKYFLTSDAVDVTKLEFDCKLANYGNGNQSAQITYTINLQKRNRSLNNIYELNNDQPTENSFTNYHLTRTVNVRNSTHPFIFNQTGSIQ